MYDDSYYEKFFGALKPLLERQIGDAIAATAAVISGAWEEAGRPSLNAERPLQ